MIGLAWQKATQPDAQQVMGTEMPVHENIGVWDFLHAVLHMYLQQISTYTACQIDVASAEGAEVAASALGWGCQEGIPPDHTSA